MAYHTINHICGHTDTRQFFGGTKDRNRKIEWLRGCICRDCEQKALEVKRAEENKRNTEANLEAGLPQLVGTERQVAWAETIRAGAIASPHNRFKDRGPGDAAMAEKFGISLEDLAIRRAAVSDAAHAAHLNLMQQTSAKWWIDNRYNVASYVYDAIREASRLMTADIQERLDREKAEKEAAKRAADEAQRAREMAEYQARRVTEGAKATTFRVSDRQGAVEVKGSNLIIKSRDGRTALGFIDAGEWAVYQIGDSTSLDSSHSEMERIASEARAIWQATQA